ncbi:MAG: aminomethyl-transferring glycine dehydrogenase subunit GcvPB, partial [Euryarchaeota archaeon]|nr:aminomethyl-transferring glycine dehydrogenase subunit GcvPB [Euryarchaeota archaeon]
MSHLFDSHGAVGSGWSQPEPLLPESRISLPANLIRRKMPQWPRISESEVVRHFTWLSTRNFGIDTGFYPLGSCTMKHNPRVNETIADISGIAEIHPMQPEHHIQGLLAIF